MKWRAVVVGLGLTFSAAPFALAAEGKTKSKPAEKNDSPIAATVDGQPIHVDEVERTVAAGRKPAKSDDRSNPFLTAQGLELVINQRLIERVLKKEHLLPTAEVLDTALAQVKKDALGRYASWEEYLQAQKLTEQALRRQTAWRFGWKAYLAEHLTDDVRQKFFETHQAEFDGTELQVSHILLKVPESASPDGVQGVLEKAQKLREEIIGGKIPFDEAARKHSAGPSAKEGGDLGYIPRRGPMAEEFARAAFALKPGEISQPVRSAFGIHLIQVTEVRPGSKTWTDVKSEMEPHVIQQIFNDLAKAERSKAKVKYTGATAYLDPESGKIVAEKSTSSR